MNVYKLFGQNYEDLNDDAFLTWVGSMGSICTSLRFLWSAALDQKSYKLVYGVLLVCQVLVSLTMFVAIQSKLSYIIWICIGLFCEGGHFTIVPNTLKQIFGDQATSLYGIMLTYTGLSSLVMIGLLETTLSDDYLAFYLITAGCSLAALCILLFAFNETKFVYDVEQVRAALNNPTGAATEMP